MGVNEKAFKRELEQPVELDYSKIVQTASFKKLLAAKRNFIIPLSLFFLMFYFALPLMTAYSDSLNKMAYGDISWAWVFAAAQFIMTWVLCGVYSSKARKFDAAVEDIIEESKN
ncbi:DUF485 domain-containing protein [Bacillus sp. DNRA2]|uniref:DUF485 domain-containing protein n=1 Tax=Bacillus sp. DNRA2 TaxID=2723053 RepID=UPI00145E4FE4|nr:DUF485 domain-containing protein [Bacillus sp. DNRA2]NMD69894.1 DUF485 domain-containing protein [Bacillus sp. DNRA2]